MPALLTIGDFSRMTYLSVKALRHYHDVGLLEPAEIEQATGYRLYAPTQVATAQVIRRFRDLGMPVEQVKAVLQAPDVTTRNAVIVAHLQQMQTQLEQTQTTVASLRALLERPAGPITVEYRSVAPVRSVAIRDTVAMDDIDTWWATAFEQLHRALDTSPARASGPDGALYTDEYFHAGRGEVVAFVPITGTPHVDGPVELLEIPAAELAVTVHHGAFGELDQTYGALGTFVAERELGVPGPIREYYLISDADTKDETQHRTEVCWPVFQTTPRR